jgi:hypothetical protein
MANPKGIVAMLSKFGTSVTNLSRKFDIIMKSGHPSNIMREVC